MWFTPLHECHSQMDKKKIVTKWDLFAQNMELFSGRCLYALSRQTD